jgi:hypothetical protein
MSHSFFEEKKLFGLGNTLSFWVKAADLRSYKRIAANRIFVVYPQFGSSADPYLVTVFSKFTSDSDSNFVKNRIISQNAIYPVPEIAKQFEVLLRFF